MPEIPDELAAGLLELAEREVPPAGERFEAGLRQAVRWEQRRRRSQRRWLVTVGCLTALCVALAVALALPALARHLPLPVGHELRSLDAQTSDLQARLAAQAAVQASLLKQLSAQAYPPAEAGSSLGIARRRGHGRPRRQRRAGRPAGPGCAPQPRRAPASQVRARLPRWGRARAHRRRVPRQRQRRRRRRRRRHRDRVHARPGPHVAERTLR